MVVSRPDMTAAARALLLARGADRVAHPGGTLLAHLDRVHDLLAGWHARPALRLAGLCHAFYGTDGFAVALLPLDRRDELVAAIGVEAEGIVHRYASCDRDATYPGMAFHDRFRGAADPIAAPEMRDFAELTAANELDLVLVGAIRAGAVAPLLERLWPWLSLRARGSCDRALRGG